MLAEMKKRGLLFLDDGAANHSNVGADRRGHRPAGEDGCESDRRRSHQQSIEQALSELEKAKPRRMASPSAREPASM